MYEVCKSSNETGNIASDPATLRRQDLEDLLESCMIQHRIRISQKPEMICFQPGKITWKQLLIVQGQNLAG
ncbi:hypothetical protein NQ318_012123 [Aromia moschata]|uniref:Uncharacterized protein n=1 Tax=Aromia moschata TaxID=1265417 RepID=A0AAV8YRP2_9CUCU|nr:hypothetical protein NQ318_012123 [Aromia moschata]